MPKIVDKAQKRYEIADASKELLLQKGIAQLTVSEVAKHAGIGKGTIYQYFKSKDDIVFAIFNALIDQELEELDKDIEVLPDFDAKLFRFFDFILNVKKNCTCEKKVYLEYLAIAINSDNEEMINFNLECREKLQKRLRKIVDEAIAKKQIKEMAKECIFGLYALEKGFILLDGTENNIDLKDEAKKFLKAFIELVKL